MMDLEKVKIYELKDAQRLVGEAAGMRGYAVEGGRDGGR